MDQSNISDLYERIRSAWSPDSNLAGIRIVATYEPLGGPGTKVFPPTVLDGRRATYLKETRWRPDGQRVETVLLDSYQSQANRAEVALRDANDDGSLGIRLPLIEIRTTGPGGQEIRITSLDAPHRCSDAYFRDAETDDGTAFDDTECGRAIRASSERAATALFRWCPTALIYGTWDSHRQGKGAKIARSYVAEVVGLQPQDGQRAGSRMDPLPMLNFKLARAVTDPSAWELPADPEPAEAKAPGQKEKQKQKGVMTDIGHGVIPPALDQVGGVTVSGAERTAYLSFAGLGRLAFPDDAGGSDPHRNAAARAALACLALAGDRLAFAGAALRLRSGCDLVLCGERIEWVLRGASPEPLNLDPRTSLDLLRHAVERARELGLPWEEEPVRLRPKDKLARAIEASLTKLEEAELDAAEAT